MQTPPPPPPLTPLLPPSLFLFFLLSRASAVRATSPNTKASHAVRSPLKSRESLWLASGLHTVCTVCDIYGLQREAHYHPLSGTMVAMPTGDERGQGAA